MDINNTHTHSILYPITVESVINENEIKGQIIKRFEVIEVHNPIDSPDHVSVRYYRIIKE